MDSKANTYKSQASFIENMNGIVVDGYALKKYNLKTWIYDNGHTQPFIARVMGVDPNEFKRMLRDREKFNREQLRRLINFMGAEEAFEVIFFPSRRQRKKVLWEVFGKYKKKGELNE